LAQSRILLVSSPVPLVRILLSLAETVVESGVIRNPLEYYKELANRSSPWIALPETHPIPSAKIYQVCSAGVKKLCAAMALCPSGIRAEQGEMIHIVLLISAPTSAVPSFLALLAQTVRLLEPRADREALLASTTPAEAWAFLSRLESERAAWSSAPGRH
jgi:hypothetical protein